MQAPTPTPTSSLFVQARTVCEITQQESTGIYLLSAIVGKEMIAKEFMEKFDNTIFATLNPNATVTFTSTTAAVGNNGLLLVELSQPFTITHNHGNYIKYYIMQLESQSDVLLMDQFFEVSDVLWLIFIDSATGGIFAMENFGN